MVSWVRPRFDIAALANLLAVDDQLIAAKPKFTRFDDGGLSVIMELGHAVRLALQLLDVARPAAVALARHVGLHAIVTDLALPGARQESLVTRHRRRTV
jgi:hypothetical protein